MSIFEEFMSSYGTTIIYAVITAIAGYIGVVVKNIYNKYINDKTKKDVVKTCVNAVEQLYKDLHGEEKLNKCIEYVTKMLDEKGITITELEIRMFIEAAVREFKYAFDTESAQPALCGIEIEAAADSDE